MTAPANFTILRRAFVDICRGYSTGLYDGKPLYVRHLTHHEHTEYDLDQARFEAEGILKKAKRETERLVQLRAEGRWTDAQDKEIARQRDTIVRFEDTIRDTPQPSVVESLSQQLEGERVKLAKLLENRAELFGMTAEVYGQRMLNDYYIVTNLFQDKELTQLVFSREVFDDMANSDVEAVLAVYHGAIEPCSDNYLRQLVVQDFFMSYYGLCQDRADAFYGKPIAYLTYYQIRLASIARYFKSIMDGMEMSKMPPNTQGDPDAIERLYTAQKKAGEMKNEGKAPTNMTASDIEKLGLKGEIAHVKKEESGLEMVRRLQAGRRQG